MKKRPPSYKDDDIVRANSNIGNTRNYGGNGFTIANNLGIPPEEGEVVYNAYFKAFPKLKSFFNFMQKKSRKLGYILIDPITNRKYWFKKPSVLNGYSKIDRLSLNFPIQGEAGGITKYAVILFRKWVLENDLWDKVLITNVIHDK